MISIIVPVLNEEKGIAQLLHHLSTHAQRPENIEILVVDGGSTDKTSDIVSGLQDTIANLSLIASEKGRACQMNTGAKMAKGGILYFLHADSFPPKKYDEHILEQVQLGSKAGCFRMKFDSNHWWLRLAGWFTRFNWRSSRGGDQSLFITKELFEDIGGYDEDYIICEDSVLINELYSRKQFSVIPKWLISSARKYRQNGVANLQYHFCMIYIKKRFGASPESLHRYYKKNILS